MKKLIAIFLSVLMLCSVLPFATVAAADEPTIVAEVVDVTEVNAGDVFQVTVSLMKNPGVVSAKVKIEYDREAFELVPYEEYDEEEDETYEYAVEKASGWNSKYLTYPQLSSGNCLLLFTNGTASKNVTKELFFTATFKVKNDAVSGTYTFEVVHNNGDFSNLDGDTVVFGAQDATIVVNGKDPEPEVPSCEHEYNYDCDKNCAKCGEETRPEADHAYFYACDAHCMYCYELTNENAAHNEVHVDAVPATCTTDGNIEYWYCADCGAAWDANGMAVNRFTVIVPAAHTYDNDCDPDCNVCFENREELAHNIIHVEANAATCTTEGNLEYWYCDVCGAAWLDAECTLNTNLKAVVLPASCSYGAQYVEAKAATCFEPGNTEYWYCANCDVYYADEACAIVTNSKNVIIPITHNIIAVEAKAATCSEAGNIAYWYCADCGQAWLDEYCHLNTNLKSVVLPASCSYGAQYVEAKAATCFEPGNTEYWYCANCDVYYADEACAIVTNAKNVIIPISHNIIAVEAAPATCEANGNIAYWYCADCGQAWLDEYCHLNTNLKAVVLPATGHAYSADNDASCDNCGEIRDIAAEDIIVSGGKSISEDVAGLAFKFDAAVNGIVIGEKYAADYTNATVTINGVEYKLVGMGAIANNKGYAAQTLENVDGKNVLDIPAAKVFNGSSYAIRIINIPAEYADVEITVCSYYTYVNADGVETTVYGEDIIASYAEIAG